MVFEVVDRSVVELLGLYCCLRVESISLSEGYEGANVLVACKPGIQSALRNVSFESFVNDLDRVCRRMTEIISGDS